MAEKKDGSIGWGKCSILVKDLDTDGAKWTKLPTPKDSTTELTPSKGDKQEATIEGGENEDVKYKKSTYALAYTIRRNTYRKKPFKDKDGVVAHHYAVFVQPENISVPGPYMEKSTVSLEDPFDTTDGGQLTYTHDSLVPDDGSNQVKWGTITKDLSTVEEGATVDDADFVFTDIDADTTETASTSNG